MSRNRLAEETTLELFGTPFPLRPSWVRERLRAMRWRADSESEQAWIRLIAGALAMAVCLFAARGAPGAQVFIAGVFGVFFGTALLILYRVIASDATTPSRLTTGAALDYTTLILALGAAGPGAAVLLPLLVMMACGFGLRFGRSYALLCILLALAGLGALYLTGPPWAEQALLLQCTALTVAAVPLHIARLGERLSQAHNELRAVAESMHRAAHFDSLTGLFNRKYFHDVLEQTMARRRANDASGSIAVLYIDLDGFKAVNDRYGHHIGDRLLYAVGEKIRDAVRASDQVGRIGGDEFAVLLDGLRDAEDAERVSWSVVQSIGSIGAIDGLAVEVSASVGALVVPDDALGADAPQVLRDADAAMYAAKRSGKNRAVVARASQALPLFSEPPGPI